jgi:glutamate synthase domain-containing protein 2
MPRTWFSASLLSRYTAFMCCLLLAAIGLWYQQHAEPGASWPLVTLALGCLLGVVGVYDLLQPRRAVLRNYPVIGHIRYLVESIRPEIRQYLLEADDDKLPFSRAQRSLVYQRAKNEPSEKPFGTLSDVYQDGYEFIGHSMRPQPEAAPEQLRVLVGGEQCRQRYSASVLNISALSFGAMSANAIRALNRGAQLGGFAHDTGEGSISPYHREFGGDLIWELGSGYFGCRDARGQFDAVRFAEQAQTAQVKMIEIKLSQGAKPGHGGILPGAKVTAEIASTRGVPMGVDCISPAAHSAFSTPTELLQFVDLLRGKSGGKPVGFKLCIGHAWEFMAIVKAMLATGITPDFIVIDGKEGGTGAAPVEFTNHIGMPMREGLLFAHNTLVGAGLRQKMRLAASGKIVSAFDIACVLAIGADWSNSARAFMFAVGCIQSQSCNTNKCPTGVATQDALRQRALVVDDKSLRVRNYHRSTLKALAQILAAAGLTHPSQLRPLHLVRRVDSSRVQLFSQAHVFLEDGELLSDSTPHRFYADSWRLARADRFDPAG